MSLTIVTTLDTQFGAATNHGMNTTASRHNGGYFAWWWALM
jgi:hypothetical protein